MIYLINIGLLLIEKFVLLTDEKNEINKKIFCYFACIQWILISGLRHLSVGPDTEAYKRFSWNVTLVRNWTDIFNSFIEITFLGVEGKDPGYNLFQKFIQIFTQDYQVYLVIIAIIFTVPMTIWIYKNSKDVCLSFLIYSTLFYSFFAITGHRQTIATAISVFGGYYFLKKNQLIPFLLCCILPYPIHHSCLIVLLMYPLSRLKFSFKYIWIFILLSIVFIGFMDIIIQFIQENAYDYKFYEGSGAYNFTFFYCLIILYSIIMLKKVLINWNFVYNISYFAVFMGLVFVPLTFFNPSCMRIVQYFSLYIIILIPNLIYLSDKNLNKFLNLFSYSILILYMVTNDLYYKFFWQ